MKTLLQINSLVNTSSTGLLAEEIGQKAMDVGNPARIIRYIEK
jgi:hypothetical protein